MGSSESICVQENDTPAYFEWDYPVLRRGSIFCFSLVKRVREIKKKGAHRLKIHLSANGQNLENNHILYTHNPVSKSQWKLTTSKDPQDKMVFYLETASDCEIGDYEATIMYGGKVLGKEKFLMLCNPWNPKDEAYIPDEEKRQEYILNTETIIYKGHSFATRPHMWSLDQFSRETIEALLFLLKQMDQSLRSNAYSLVRELTALVNHKDDNGVIVGRWESNYSGGKSPEYWSNSKEILTKYMKNKKSVKFGQCFTFSGVLCSLLRLAGVGCRIVTGYDCLNDADDSLDMEMYYDEEYNWLPELSDDSIWNFHVWNECYLTCPSAEKYNGWHAVDATPQAKSKDGRYTCGPAPVAAIKTGDLTVGHDTRFLFSAVNGDVINKRRNNGVFETFDVEVARIGKSISTKALGTNTRMDITHEYKYIDGTLLDVMARKNANGLVDEKKVRDLVHVEAVNQIDHILMGEDLDLHVNLLHECDAPLEIVIKCFVLQHPNIRSGEISNNKILLGSKSENKIPFKVAGRDILSKVESDTSKVLVEVFIVEGESVCKKNFYFPIKTPCFDIVSPKEVKSNKKLHVCVKLANPLPIDLENVCVALQVEFFDKKLKMRLGRVTKGSTIEANFNLIPNKKGFHEIKAVIFGDNLPVFKEVKSINIM